MEKLNTATMDLTLDFIRFYLDREYGIGVEADITIHIPTVKSVTIELRGDIISIK